MQPRYSPKDVPISDASIRRDSVLEAVAAESDAAPDQEDGSMPVSVELKASREYKGYQALVSRAVDVFGDEIKASLWLSGPNIDLQGKAPLQVAESLHYDPRKVEKIFEPLFTRIEHGIYM